MTDPMTYRQLDDSNRELSTALKKAVDEMERLKDECERLVLDQHHVISEYNRLRTALKEYGQHKYDCNTILDDESDQVLHDYQDCTCGLDKAFGGE